MSQHFEFVLTVKNENGDVYYLSHLQDQLLLTDESGEGMGIFPAEFYELLDKYYKENY